jgi:hypothetical protein
MALAMLEERKSLFSFENTAELVALLAAEAPETGLRSKLASHVLDRLVNAKNCWRPSDKQWDLCRKLCELIHREDKSIWILSLQVVLRKPGI